jgi:hypothetical protein
VSPRAGASAPASSPEAQLEGFVAKFEPAGQKLIRAARKALRARWPTAHELVYDNYNFFVIGYSPTDRPSDAIVSLACAANGVGLCFLYGATLPDPAKLLQGSGNRTRFVRLPSVEVLRRPEVNRLLVAAEAQAKAPFAKTGRGALVIRSISKRQRPRRRPASKTR